MPSDASRALMRSVNVAGSSTSYCYCVLRVSGIETMHGSAGNGGSTYAAVGRMERRKVGALESLTLRPLDSRHRLR